MRDEPPEGGDAESVGVGVLVSVGKEPVERDEDDVLYWPRAFVRSTGNSGNRPGFCGSARKDSA
jgi:hypothetical protein